MEKPKRKRKTKYPIDFVSPFSLETCVHRLENKEGKERDFWMRPAYKVSLACLDTDTYRFSIAKRANKGYSARIGGYLKRQDSESTLVVGGPKGEIIMIVAFIGVMLLGLTLALTSKIPGQATLFYGITLPVVFGAGWVYLKMETAALTRTLQDMLGYIA